MKKIFSIIAAVLFAGSMMAADATMAAGNNGSEAEVNGKAAIKVGTSKLGGDMTITVGAGATKLTFYAAAWNNVNGLSLNITAPSGVTVNPASVSLTMDPGISNNPPFTLSGSEANFKHEVELSGVNSETTLKLTGSAAKRFVVWGATYETGQAAAVATPVISGEDKFEESTTVTITCSTAGASIFYTLDGTEPSSSSNAYSAPFTLTETATVKAKAIKSNDESAVASKTFTKVEPLADPTNCAEAREAALSVSGNNVEYNDGKVYTIEGYVTSIQTAYSDQYHNITFWMADDPNGGNVLEAYRAACASAADAPSVGDKVAVTGKLTKYNSTPEFAAGCTFTILEHGQVEPAKNLGEKSIEEFLSLKNEKDTCILTGVVKNIVMDKEDPTKPNKYGNFDLVDEENEEISVYIYGLLTATGESQQFVEMGINEDDIIKIKAIYSEFNGKPQVKNAILVEHTPGGSQTAIDNTAVEVKAQKVVRDGQLFIIRNGVVFNANGTIVK